jgi:hypothetical protein
MNKVCILKLGRKIQTGAQDFWCEVLLGKYKRGTAEGVVMARATDSHLWKSIVKVWSDLDAHSWWTIGVGKTIDLCHDAWIEDGMRLEDCNLQIPDNLRGVKLINIVDNGDWNWNMMNAWLPMDIKERIVALLPPVHSNGNNVQLCKENAMGCFSIAEMYYALCQFDMKETHKGWTPPSVGWVCLNVDGACRDGSIRGNEGEWIHGFSKFIGRGDVCKGPNWKNLSNGGI